jgi:hypothetical protein
MALLSRWVKANFRKHLPVHPSGWTAIPRDGETIADLIQNAFQLLDQVRYAVDADRQANQVTDKTQYRAVSVPILLHPLGLFLLADTFLR